MAKATKKELTPVEKLEQALVPEDEQPYEVPKNWVWVRLGALLIEIKNGTTIQQDKSYAGYSVTRIESLQNNTVDYSRLGTIVDEAKIKENDWYVEKDIALSHINSVKHVGKTALIDANMLPLVHGMNLLRLRFNSACTPELFQFYSQSFQYKASIIERINMAVNQVSINQKQLSSLELPLAPLAEQQRIVDRIESLFEKLDQAKELVQNAFDSFETRKAAILHKAFTGELTAKWRERNGMGMDSWRDRQLHNVCKINPPRVDVRDLENDTEVTFLPMPSVSDVLGTIINPQTRKLNQVRSGYTSFAEGDILFAKITPCMENGKSAIVGKLLNDVGFGSTEFHVLRCSGDLNNWYMYHFIRNQNFRDEAKAVMTGAVGQQRVPRSFLENYSLILPSLPEQQEIVRILDNLLEKEQQAKELYDVIDKIDLMKKAILARAFRGQLGTNDPSEESAMELLKMS